MANQIATQHESAGLSAAAATVQAHIERFWTGQMKADLVEHASLGEGDVSPAVLAALDGLTLSV